MFVCRRQRCIMKRLIDWFRGIEVSHLRSAHGHELDLANVAEQLSNSCFQAQVQNKSGQILVSWSPIDWFTNLFGWVLVAFALLGVVLLLFGITNVSLARALFGMSMIAGAFALGRWMVLVFRPKVKKTLYQSNV